MVTIKWLVSFQSIFFSMMPRLEKSWLSIPPL